MDEKQLVVIFMIVAIVALSVGATMFNTWIRARHGYPLEEGLGSDLGLGIGGGSGNDEKVKRLEAENRDLHETVNAIQDRMVVLEKIVTDKGYGLADEIEALRGEPVRSVPSKSDAGVPLNIQTKEPHS